MRQARVHPPPIPTAQKLPSIFDPVFPGRYTCLDPQALEPSAGTNSSTRHLLQLLRDAKTATPAAATTANNVEKVVVSLLPADQGLPQ